MKEGEPVSDNHWPLVGLGIIWLLAIAGYAISHPQGKPPATPVSTQEFYERERAGLHSLEATDIETTEQKLDRIRRRDAASRQSP